MKTFHMRRNYNPCISEDTKDLIKNRNALQKEATRTKCNILKKEFYILCKEVKKAIAMDEKEFFERGFDDSMDSTKLWRTADGLLGTVKKPIANRDNT